MGKSRVDPPRHSLGFFSTQNWKFWGVKASTDTCNTMTQNLYFCIPYFQKSPHTKNNLENKSHIRAGSIFLHIQNLVTVRQINHHSKLNTSAQCLARWIPCDRDELLSVNGLELARIRGLVITAMDFEDVWGKYYSVASPSRDLGSSVEI